MNLSPGDSEIDRLLATIRGRISQIDPLQAHQLRERGALFVDTRPDFQRSQFGAIPDALLIERNHLEWALDPTSQHRHPSAVGYVGPIVVFCQEGYSSSLAVAALADLGVPDVHDLRGGFAAWENFALPTTANAAASTALNAEPLSGRIGALVAGVDLRSALDERTIKDVADALVRHKVLFFRHQHLDPVEHVTLARCFGMPTMAHPTVPSLDGHPNVFELDAASGARANVWHTDVTFVARSPRASILNAVTIPDVGGDTLWANTESAYLDLPDHLRAFVDTLWARHSNTSDYGSITTAGDAYTASFLSAHFEARHPVVRVHPVSGRRSLLLGGFARRIDGLSSQESSDLIRTLQTYVTRPENTVRWRWNAGDVVMWDNQATQHYAIDDYGTQPRRVQRVTLVGDPALSVDGSSSEAVAGDTSAYLSLG